MTEKFQQLVFIPWWIKKLIEIQPQSRQSAKKDENFLLVDDEFAGKTRCVENNTNEPHAGQRTEYFLQVLVVRIK